MRILAVDASFRRTGVACIDFAEGHLALYRFSSRPKDTSWFSLQTAIEEICSSMSPLLRNTDVYIFEQPFPHGSYSAGLYALNTALYRAVAAKQFIGYGPSLLAHIHGRRNYGKSASVALAQRLLNAIITFYSLEFSQPIKIDGVTPNIAYKGHLFPHPNFDRAKAAHIDEADPNGLSNKPNNTTNITNTTNTQHTHNIQHTTNNHTSTQTHSNREEDKKEISSVLRDTGQSPMQCSQCNALNQSQRNGPNALNQSQCSNAVSVQSTVKPNSTEAPTAASNVKAVRKSSVIKARLSHDEAEAFIYLCKAIVQYSFTPVELTSTLSAILEPPRGSQCHAQ